MSILLFALAILALILILYAPGLVRLRIRILKWLGWKWAVNILEKYFDHWVVFVRVVLFLISVVLFSLGWEDFRE